MDRATTQPLLDEMVAGGDVNITDDDGDTPLYTVENVETAKWLIDHGAIVDRRNSEGISVSLLDQCRLQIPDMRAARRAPSGRV